MLIKHKSLRCLSHSSSLTSPLSSQVSISCKVQLKCFFSTIASAHRAATHSKPRSYGLYNTGLYNTTVAAQLEGKLESYFSEPLPRPGGERAS